LVLEQYSRMLSKIATRAARHVLPAVVLCAFCGVAAAETGHDTEHAAEGIGALLPLWSVIPFAGILLSIALFPLFAPKWWHHHFPKVSAFWALLLAVPLLIAFRGIALHEILHVYILEYIPFIILLWALFTVAGGIHVKGTLTGTPALNVLLLIIGTALASWMGTTGASMILIRTIIRANAWRRYKVHVIIFFIFLVSNIGGSLTPLGDPPLFLGFLLGVPFFWTMKILPHMLLVSVPLLVIFYVIDSLYFRREEKPESKEKVPFRVEGAHNLIFLGGIVGAVLMSGMWRPGDITILGIHVGLQHEVRDLFLIVMGLASLAATKKQIRTDNEFSWFPIKEVAILFAGIFMTIVPAIAILQAGDKGPLGPVMDALRSPGHYFWITGSLSAFLDNAPSYLTFFNSLLGKFYTGLPHLEGVHGLLTDKATYLQAISAGAVFFGALTYIGNAPNFMVKAIAEEAGVRMPSFFGYMFKYALPVLVPLFLLVTFVLF
jgi:Na+/H+ antiporter NhaD/arsenite permease-like protein